MNAKLLSYCKLPYLLVLIAIIVCIPVKAQTDDASPSIQVVDYNGEDKILVDCNYPVDENRCLKLTANYTTINETISYDVLAVDYQDPVAGLTENEIIEVGGDDVWSTVLDLPFTFCFFDDSYDQFVLGDNGVITFDATVAGLESQFIRSQLPSGNLVGNAIFGIFHDMLNVNKDGCNNAPETPINECGEIKLYTVGTAPSRAFIISYEDMNHFACENVKSTCQMVLYETSNTIEVYIKDKPNNCEFITTGDDPDVVTGIINRKNALIGIQNKEKNTAYFPPNRNNSEWSTANEAWRFSPNGTTVTQVEWKDETGAVIAAGDELLICPEENTSYTATVTYQTCLGGNLSLSDTIPIDIDISYPVATNVNEIICDVQPFAEEEVNLNDFESQLIGMQTGLIISYHTSVNDARNNVNAIINLENYVLTAASTYLYARLQRGISCFDVGTIVLSLFKVGEPAVSEIAVCDLDNDDTEILDLTNFNTVLIGSQSNMNISYHFSQADAESNINPQTELIAVPGSSVFVRFTIGAEERCPNVVELPVRLKPKPIVKNIPIELCDHIPIYDLTQHEAEIETLNTIPLTFSYHIFLSWAQNNVNPIAEEDIEQYVHNKRATIYVRAEGPENCYEIFELNFTYPAGIPVSDDQQIQLGNVFDLTQSIRDMIGDDTGIAIEYVDCDTKVPIVDPANYQINNPEATACVIFTNLESGCKSDGIIDLTDVGGAGSGGGGGFASCDVNNNNIETFTLVDFTEDIIERATFEYKELLEVSYHITEQQAINNTDEITEITISANQTIYIRFSVVFEENELTFWTEEMVLEFKPTTPFIKINDGICDVRNNNREVVDLTQYEAEILNGNSGSFTYFDVNDMEINNPVNYIFVGPEKEILVLIETPDGCENETTITLTFDAPIPAVNTRLEACDFDNDRQEIFNLNEALPNINMTYTSFNISYYITQSQADDGDVLLAILNPETYLLNRSSRRIYVRLEDAEGCYTTTFIDLRIIRVPQFVNTTVNVCDFENNLIEENVELSTYNFSLIGTQRGVVVEYYETQQNAIDQANAVTTLNITPSTILYVNLKTGANCIQRSMIVFNFTPTPQVKDLQIVVCDNETDNTEVYNLTQHETDITTDQSNKTITYYATEENAILNSNRILTPAFYTISTAPQTVYVRVEDDITRCFSIAEIEIKFILPTPVTNTRMQTCDVGADGSEIFDVTTVLDSMINNPNNFDISYYTRRSAAATADPTFAVANPKKTDTAIASTIYVRFYDEETGCYSIGEIFLELLKTPKLLRGEFELCDTDFDSFYTLDLADINTQMIQNTEGLVFSYFNSFSDANESVNSIGNSESYTIPAFPHRVYARVEGDNSCFSISFVDMKIREQITVNTVTEVMESCDDDRDEFAIFDLTQFESIVTSESGAVFRYYNSKEEANKLQNEISNPTNYKNQIEKEQDIFVRVSATGKCDNITSFKVKTIKITPDLKDVSFCDGEKVTLDAGSGYSSYLWNTGATTQTIDVFQEGEYTISLEDTKGCKGVFTINAKKLPLPYASNASITLCDEDGIKNEVTSFNLNTANDKITGGAANVSTHFYNTALDLDSDNNEISPVNYSNTSNPQVLFVKILDATTLCYNKAQLTLTVSSTTANPASIEICDELSSQDGISLFTLTNANQEVLTGTSATGVSYHKTFTEARLAQNALEAQYQNTRPYLERIYARTENSDGCFDISPVDLVTNKLPSIELVENVVYCQNFYPETIALSSDIAPSLFSNYSFEWSTGETKPVINTNEPGTYTVKVTNTSGCSKTKEIIVAPTYIETFNASMLECDDDGILDNRTSFDLTTLQDRITGKNTELSLLFYRAIQDAENDVNRINATSYINVTNPEIVYAKAINNTASCYAITKVELIVSSIKANSAILEECDAIESEDGIAEFYLANATPQVIDGLPITNVQYFETFNDAKESQKPLDNTYSNTSPYIQEIFSRIINADGCVGIGTVTLIVNELPDIVTEEEVGYCLNIYPETITLTSGVRLSEIEEFTYNWSTGATSPTIEVNENGTYKVVVTSVDGCQKERTIEVVPSEIAIIERIEIEDKEQIKAITVFVSGIGDYEFSLDDQEYQESNFFNNISAGLYTIYVRDKIGCGVVKESISVLGFPNFFTPNNDGYNDTWKPLGFSPQFQQDMEVFIYDRYGKLLSKIDPLNTNGWDGTINGKALPSTDYWYTANYRESFSGKNREFRGHFSLVR